MTQQFWGKDRCSFRPSKLLRQKDSVYSNLEDNYFRVIPKLFRNNVRPAGSFVPERFDGDLLFFAAVETLGGPMSANRSQFAKSPFAKHT